MMVEDVVITHSYSHMHIAIGTVFMVVTFICITESTSEE